MDYYFYVQVVFITFGLYASGYSVVFNVHRMFCEPRRKFSYFQQVMQQNNLQKKQCLKERKEEADEGNRK